MVMNISGPPWVVDIPAGNALALTAAQVQAAQALLGNRTVTVGVGGEYSSLEEACERAGALSPAADN